MALPALSLSAPAKLNLYLHVTGKRDDGYHLLDSLCVFTDIADAITLRAADEFSLTIIGPFAAAIAGDAIESNLVTCAVHALAAHLGRTASVAITLTKNIPPGAGLGGGSSDAAVTIKGLLELWDAQISDDDLYALLGKLGSDVPACYAGLPVMMGGIGDRLKPAPILPASAPLVVVYPNIPSSTIAAYQHFGGPFTPAAAAPGDISTLNALCDFLQEQTNDLYGPALQSVPVIDDVLGALSDQNGIKFAAMSGSGSACFGIFENGALAERAVSEISRLNPSWWVRRGDLWSPH